MCGPRSGNGLMVNRFGANGTLLLFLLLTGLGWCQPEYSAQHNLRFNGTQQFFTLEAKSYPRLITLFATTQEEHAIALGVVQSSDLGNSQLVFQRTKKNGLTIERMFVPSQTPLRLVYALDREGTLRLEVNETQLGLLKSGAELNADTQGVLEVNGKTTAIKWNSEARSWYTLCLAQFPGSKFSVQLKGRKIWETYQASDQGSICLPNLSPGELALELFVTQPKLDPAFQSVYIHLQQQQETAEKVVLEQEPYETNWDLSHSAGGVLHDRADRDTFLFTVAEDSSKEGLKLEISPQEEYLNYSIQIRKTDSRETLFAKSGHGEQETDWLYLPVGTYALSLHGADSSLHYTITGLTGNGSEKDMAGNREVEPNDTKKFANTLGPATLVRGVLRDMDDTDVFRLDTTSAGAAQRWLVQVVGEGVASLQLNKRSVKKPVGYGSMRLHGVFLLPGLHFLSIRGAGDYSVFARPLGALQPGMEREPNDPQSGVAQVISFGETVTGSFDGVGDVDSYRFSVYRRQDVLWSVKAPLDTALTATLSWANERLEKKEVSAGETLEKTLALEAGDYSVNISNRDMSQDEYTLELDVVNPKGGVSDNQVYVELALKSSDLRSSSRFGQRLAATLVARSHSKTPIQLWFTLSSFNQTVHSSLPSTITVDGGATVEQEVIIDFPPDIPAGEGLLSLHVRTGSESQIIPISFHATEFAVLRDPFTWFAVPPVLRGTVDVAQVALGGNIQGAVPGAPIYSIINGIAPYWSPPALGNSEFKQGVQINLDRAYQVHGFYFNTATPENNSSRLRSFEIHYWNDKGNWELAAKGSLAASNDNQYIALDSPVTTDRVLLKPIDNFNSKKSDERATLQEFGVLAFPNQQYDLGEHAKGAHVVYHTFDASWRAEQGVHLIDGLSDESKSSCAVPKGQAGASWIVGLHNNRAARIESIKYVLADGSKARLPVPDLWYSVDGPFGPWTSAPGPSVTQREIDWIFPGSVYVRFLKFHSRVEPKKQYSCAMDLQIREHSADDSYRSILGEWGGFFDEGPFENYQLGDRVTEFTPAGGASLDVALPLEPNLIESSVRLERNVDWFKFVVPEDQNSFTVKLEKPAFTRLSVDLYRLGSEDAEPVLGDVEETNERVGTNWNVQQATWFVEGGGQYFLRVSEAPRNIVVTWDQSGSVAKSRDYIESGLHDWSQHLAEGKEVVQLFPFVEAPLTDGWAGYPFLVQAGLAKETQSYSSDADKALVQANELLGDVSGARSIIVTTDADGPSDKRLWPLFERVCPRVFVGGLSASSSVSGAKENVLTDNMQDWASVCGGEYREIKGFEQLESLFQVAGARLRSPKSYRLGGRFEWRAPPKPGRLVISFGLKSASKLHQHLSIVADTSGSMLQRLGTTPRIEIARRALEAMAQGLPEHLGVSLLTFGETEGSCSIVTRLSGKDSSRSKLVGTIKTLKAVNNVKTPLAAALSELEERLHDSKGDETVVLLTDGEETCGGDPEAAIARLRSSGVSVQIEIVGFAIDDSKLKDTFRKWARIGAGNYWDAKDEQDLTRYLRTAVSPVVVVSDKAGRVVFRGPYEKPLSLQPGLYRVRVGKGQSEEIKEIKVEPGRDSVVKF